MWATRGGVTALDVPVDLAGVLLRGGRRRHATCQQAGPSGHAGHHADSCSGQRAPVDEGSAAEAIGPETSGPGITGGRVGIVVAGIHETPLCSDLPDPPAPTPRPDDEIAKNDRVVVSRPLTAGPWR